MVSAIFRAKWLKRATTAILVLVILFAGSVAVLSLSVRGRAVIGVGFVRSAHFWSLRWPIERGRHVLFRLIPLMTKLGAVPVRLEFEPGVVLFLDPLDYIQRLIVIEKGWQPEVLQEIFALPHPTPVQQAHKVVCL